MYPHPATILLSPCPPALALHAIRPDAFADGAAVLPKQPTAADGSAEQLAAMHHLPWQREKSPAEAAAAERAAVPAAEQRSGWTLAELPALVLAAAAEQLPGEPVFAASGGLSEAAGTIQYCKNIIIQIGTGIPFCFICFCHPYSSYCSKTALLLRFADG